MDKFLIYKSNSGAGSARVLIAGDDIWMTQKEMAALFQTTTQNITTHLKNIYSSAELETKATCKEFLQVEIEAEREVSRQVKFYNLSAIIAVGYRVNSKKATDFRVWATETLQEFIKKGFVLDDLRLKQGKNTFDKDYFRELLERIKDIRTSERRLYQQLKDIYALSFDYTKNNLDSLKFFAGVQNKVHYAITGQTAAEIIFNRSDSNKENMGLTTWRNSPDGCIFKSDVIIAKNYLLNSELNELRTIINMFLDYAELQVINHKLISMKDWGVKLDEFIKFMGRDNLKTLGNVSSISAKKKALREYDKFKIKMKEGIKEKSYSEYLEDIKELDNFIKKGS